MQTNVVPLEAYFFISLTAGVFAYATYKESMGNEKVATNNSASLLPSIPFFGKDDKTRDEEEDEEDEEQRGGKKIKKRKKKNSNKTIKRGHGK